MFNDSLEIRLNLHIDGKDFSIPCGNIKYLKCELYQYGFESIVNFWISSEEKSDVLYPHFITNKIIEVNLDIYAHFTEKDQDKKVNSITLSGIVTKKAILDELVIENVHLKKNPVLYRCYQIVFKDRAQVLLKQHYPTDLVTNKKIKDLFVKNTPSKVTIKYNWQFLNKDYAINTLPLGSPKNKASFYDFIIWFVNKYNGVFNYNYRDKCYYVTNTKEQSDKFSIVNKKDISSYYITFLNSPRYNIEILNVCSKNVQKKTIQYDSSIKDIEKTIIINTPISSIYEEEVSLEREKTKRVATHLVNVYFNHFLNIKLCPNDLIKFSGPNWSKEQFIKEKIYRINYVSFEATALNKEADSDLNMPHNRYSIRQEIILEPKDDESVSLPDFIEPYFPLLVEGYVVSEIGKDNEYTYQIYQHPQTSVDQYKIKIPLFNNQEVIAPFEPIFSPGHFYFPIYKGARVLISLNLHDAYIKRFLEWKEGARLPSDTQGDHLLLGKNAKNQTSISHIYIDDKPVLKIKRINQTDTQLVKIEEGTITIETKEEE